MAKKKFYAVRKGRETGLFSTWNDAKKQVDGFPGAEYKSFKTKTEAESFLEGSSTTSTSKKDTDSLNAAIEKEVSTISPKKAIAFIDGSYGKVKEREKYSFGAVILTFEREIELYRSYLNPEWISFRNVAGEIQGAMEAISWAIDEGKTEINMYYDYQGIEKWALGEWRANSAVAKTYVKFISEVSSKITITFHHVPAHTGVSYNERVDDLARNSLKDPNYRTHNEANVYLTGLTLETWMAIYDELQEENKALGLAVDVNSKIEETGKDYLKRVILAMGNDQVSVNLYGRDKAYVQGNPNASLYQRVLFAAIRHLEDTDEMLAQLNRWYQTAIDKETFDFAVARLLPNVSDKKLEYLLKLAVFNYLYEGYMTDYTPLLIPMYRAHLTSDKHTDFLHKVSEYYAKWAKTSSEEPVLREMNDAKELLAQGLHEMNM